MQPNDCNGYELVEKKQGDFPDKEHEQKKEQEIEIGYEEDDPWKISTVYVKVVPWSGKLILEKKCVDLFATTNRRAMLDNTLLDTQNSTSRLTYFAF